MFWYRIIRLFLSFLLFCCFCWLAFNYKLSIYLLLQAKGQCTVVLGAQNIQSFINSTKLSAHELANAELIEKIKKYSVDSLAYNPTNNFSSVYDNKHQAVLWVITASEKYSLNAYEWEFPLLGSVSYKGYFNKERALNLLNELRANNYDAGIRPVSAWSTLGWLNDPLLSSHLSLKKGKFCNLLFHELFHATFYKANNMNNNENLANFIAHKATLLFLKNDSLALNEYLNSIDDNKTINRFLNVSTTAYKHYLDSISALENAYILKQKKLIEIGNQLKKLTVRNKNLLNSRAQEICIEQNAFFIDYLQYDSKQDSLENAFNKFYKSSVKLMVQSLKE